MNIMQLKELSHNFVQCFKARYYSKKLLLLVVFPSIVLLSGCSIFDKSTVEIDEATPSEPGVTKSQPATAPKSDISPSEKAAKLKEEPGSGESGKPPAAGATSTKTPEPDQKKVDTTRVDKKDAVVEKPTTDIKSEAKPSGKASVKAVITEPKAIKKASATHKPTDPNHFVITVDDKDSRHPFFTKGYPKGFSVNDVPGKEMVMERGKTYQLEVITNPLHDVYISRKDIGWGSSAWTEGITGQFIYNGIIKVKPGKNTPSHLFYACRNHPYMGGQIYIVNPGEKAKIKKHVAPSKSAIAASKKPRQVTAAMVNQKLMFANMLIKSKTTERVQKGTNEVAKKLQAAAEISIASAKKALAADDVEKAYGFAAQGVNDLKQVKKLVPSESQLALLKSRYKELIQSLENFEKSHKKSYQRTIKKKGKESAVDYDHEKVKQLKQSAEAAVKATDYNLGNKSLDEAQRIVTLAIKKMMDSQTVVYDLNFETAEEEYEYELRRFKGYEILIPIAVKMKRPSEGAKKLMQTYLKKGQEMRDAAIAKAKGENFPVAIAMLHDATKEVRRALRMVGVNQ
ncbi:MAG: hypothetical protein ACC707_05900 [Thiohalomonadales bacterium]